MTPEATSTERLAEAARLSVLLSEQVLDALIAKRDVTADQGAALVKVARLLQDHEMEWPPLLTQVIHELVRDEEVTSSAEIEPSKPLADIFASGFSRIFSKPRTRTDKP